MATMKGWQCLPKPGPIEQKLILPATGLPRPIINDTEVLVEVHSAALNPVEFKAVEFGIASKIIFRSPVTPGMDLCGRVVEVGEKAGSFQVGDMVYGSSNGVFGHGSLAELISISKDAIALVPSGLEADDMASIAVVGMTTYQALKPHAKVGNKVFINGGSGGTGVMSIQIAKALGYHVTTSCSSANIELCKSLGADEVLDYKSTSIVEQLQSRGKIFDLILDNVGVPANLYKISHKFLVPDGKYLQVGMGMSLSAMKQLGSNVLLPSVLGGGKRKYIMVAAKANAADFEQLAAWMNAGKIKAVIDSVFDFNDVPQAFERLKTGRARGKVVVRVKGAGA